MDLVERYIFAVTSRLPANQREEVAEELRALIGDMLVGRTVEANPSKNDIEAVLLELGHPSCLADRYRGSRRYLIGPENFDTYLMILKIVVAAVTFGLTLALAIGYVVEPPPHVLPALGHYIATVLAATAQSFAWLTIIFAVAEHYGIKTSGFTREKGWRPADLPQVPAKEARIKPVEPIFGIIFAVLFIVLLNTATRLIGIYSVGEGSAVTVIPLFNWEVFRLYLPYFNVLLVLSMAAESFKLIAGKWTMALAGVNGVINIASLILVITAFSNPGIWNNGFFTYFIQSGILPADINVEAAWNIFTKVLMAVVSFGLIVDSIVSLVKALKYKVAPYL